MKTITRTIALIGTAALAATLAATPAVASTGTKCLVQHDLYQQPVAAIIAYAEAPESPLCGVGLISLKVWRNGVLVSSQSGWVALNFRYDCVTTAPTEWRTNWDATRIFNCG
ncbi:hypothetical protein ABZ345_01720 [Lentzea sp. NPDC005914]|uniref:hypothetical protein n=1 Tax=Lentzea sp. NPDC005914 TaxID=3154572 RepID=UPI0033E40AF8